MSDQYEPVDRPFNHCFWVKRPNSERVVNPVRECNRLADRITELEAENHTFRMAQKACETCDAPTMERIAELEAALRELVQSAKPKYRSTRDKDVRAGICLSGELLHYEVMPHLVTLAQKALEPTDE